MNLYFRFFKMILTWLFAKSIQPLDISEYSLRCWPNDLDANFHMNNGRFLTIFDLGRIDWLARIGLVKPFLKRRWMPVMGGCKVSFIRPVRVFQKITLKTKLLYWDEKWIYIEQEMWHKEKRMCVILMRVLFIKGKEKITPDQIMSLLPTPIQKPVPPKALLKWIGIEEKPSKPELIPPP